MKKLINSLHRFWIVIVAALLSAGTPFIARGDYYVDSRLGSDANDGETAATAWKNLTKVSSDAYFMPGDTLYLKNGSAWNQGLTLNGGGDFINGVWCYIKTYGTGAKPIIRNSPVNYDVYAYGWEDVVDADLQPFLGYPYMKIALLFTGDAWDMSGFEIQNAQMGIYGGQDPITGLPVPITGLYIHNVVIKNMKGIEVPIPPGWVGPGCENGECLWDPWPVDNYSAGIKLWDAEYVNVEDVQILNSSAGVEGYVKEGYVENVLMDKILVGGLGFNGHSIKINNVTVLNAQFPNPGCWYGGDPIMTDWTTGLTLSNSEIAYCKNWNNTQDSSPVDIDLDSVNCTVEDCFLHDNEGSALEANIAGPNHRIAFRRNVCYKNGLSINPSPNANYLKVAFLADGAGHPVNNTYEITDNDIYLAFPGQHLCFLFHEIGQFPNYGFSDDFSYLETTSGYIVSGNNIYPSGTPLTVPDPYPPLSSNLALSATVTVSSVSSGSAASRVNDGNRALKWNANTTQTPLPWVQLNWGTPQTVSRIRVFDDTVLAKWWKRGVMSFSDGSKINLTGGMLNNGQMREIVFDSEPKTITWVRFTATEKVGSNIGLAELEVYAAVDPGPEDPPIAPGNTTVNFNDRPAGATLLAGQYPSNPNGINWGTVDWTTESVGGNRFAHIVFSTEEWNYSMSMFVPGKRTQIGRTFTIPHGKELKSVKVSGPDGAIISFTQNGLYPLGVACTPVSLTYPVDTSYPPTSNIVSCWVDTTGAPGSDISEVHIDDITYGDPN